MSKVKQPSTLVFYADGNGKGETDYRCRWHSEDTDSKSYHLPARHKGGGNFTYGDLHVSFLKWERYPCNKYGFTIIPNWRADD